MVRKQEKDNLLQISFITYRFDILVSLPSDTAQTQKPPTGKYQPAFYEYQQQHLTSKAGPALSAGQASPGLTAAECLENKGVFR